MMPDVLARFKSAFSLLFRFRNITVTAFCLGFFFVSENAAKTLLVTKTADTNDGSCSADCSLREAIAAAHDNDTIQFAETGEIVLSGGELVIGKNLTIAGTGATALLITRSATAPAARIFFVNASGSLTLTNADVAGGTAPLDIGGGIYSEGKLILINTAVRNNSAGEGGGIVNRGTFTATNSTISDNIATINGRGQGGGIENSGTMLLINCTIANNLATTSGNPAIYSGLGGGLYNTPGAVSTLRNVTVAKNTATSGYGGGIYGSGTILGNTIVADNTSLNGPDIWAPAITSEGYNLLEDIFYGSLTGTMTGNIVGVDPQFDADGLRYNGGSVKTISLQSASPAIDKGKGSIAGVATDQRGFLRPYDNAAIGNAPDGDGCDIGAFEVQPSLVTIGGRVLTNSGAVIRNAIVSLTNQTTGEKHLTITNNFGYYRFPNTSIGQTYIFAVQHKKYTFTTQSINVTNERSDIILHPPL